MKPKVKKRIVLFIIFCGIMVFTISIGGCRWASPPPETKFQNLEELRISLADENMWFFDVDLGINETDFQKEGYILREEKVSGGGCTKEKERFNVYIVKKDLRKGDAYITCEIYGFSSVRDQNFLEEYNYDGIPGMLSCDVKNRMDSEGYGDYKCRFYFPFIINDKSYSIMVEQYTWKTRADKTEAEDSIFGKIITKEIFLELVETAITNRFQ